MRARKQVTSRITRIVADCSYNEVRVTLLMKIVEGFVRIGRRLGAPNISNITQNKKKGEKGNKGTRNGLARVSLAIDISWVVKAWGLGREASEL